MQIAPVADGTLRIEEAFANGLNFQDIESVCQNFDQLDQNLAVRQELRKRYGRRKENFFSFVEIALHRHRLVHHAEKYWDYDLQSLRKDLAFCEVLIRHIYRSIANRKNWVGEKPF